MKKIWTALLIGILCMTLVSASSYVFKKDDIINFQLKCIDINSTYCSVATQVLVNIDAPNGTNVVDNLSATPNPTYFNFTIPTSDIGEYKVLVISPTYQNSTTEFTYLVTSTGDTMGIYLFLILAIGGFVILGFALVTKNEYLGFVAGAIFVLTGVFTMIYGISFVSDMYTRGIAYVFIGLGTLFVIVSAYENIAAGND